MAANPDLQAALRGNNILCIAMLLGPLLYAGVLAYLQWTGMQPMVGEDLVSAFATIGTVAAVLALGIAFLVRRTLWKGADPKDTSKLLQAFFAGNIMFYAFLEGAILVNLTFWLATGEANPFVWIAAVPFVIGVVAWLRLALPGTGSASAAPPRSSPS